MGDNVMSVREAVEAKWVDGVGGYNVGKENGFTVYDIAVMTTGSEQPTQDELRITQVGILQQMKRFRNMDGSILTGGIATRPVTYIIAGDEEEERDIIKRHMRYTNNAVASLDNRLVNSNQPVIVAMRMAVEGMINSMNSLLIGVSEELDK